MNLDFTFIQWPLISQFILKGAYFSVELTLIALTGGLTVGTILALARMSGKRWLALPAKFYVDLFRSIPLLMIILWFFLLIPGSFYSFLAGRWGASHRAELSAFITFTFFESAYFCEIMRSGILSVPHGQTFAGNALGMTYLQCMRLIVLPQAFRIVIPVIFTQTTILFQDTSLVYVIGAFDLFKGFDILGKNMNRPIECYLLAATTYFLVCFSLSILIRRFNTRLGVHR